jgi:hypothetical protein
MLLLPKDTNQLGYVHVVAGTGFSLSQVGLVFLDYSTLVLTKMIKLLRLIKGGEKCAREFVMRNSLADACMLLREMFIAG